ncbi:Uncharacterised protein [Mycobacteroides abscessus subsp. abscessus]|nr:Uncharacterised protein [Mycobacteroides abscessus subsp. abscessus]
MVATHFFPSWKPIIRSSSVNLRLTSISSCCGSRRNTEYAEAMYDS